MGKRKYRDIRELVGNNEPKIKYLVQFMKKKKAFGEFISMVNKHPLEIGGCSIFLPISYTTCSHDEKVKWSNLEWEYILSLRNRGVGNG